jgi:GT2 family glycosyltransferase
VTVARFSVIIAAYQAAGTIERAVHSVLAQTVPPEQVLVCDDGSTDGTAEVVRRRFGDSVTVLKQSNRGALAARNAVARLATGDWLAVLDADDWWEPTRLEAVAQLISTVPDDVDIVTTDAVLELPDRTVLGRYYDTISFPLDGQPTRLLTGNFVFGAAVIRRRRFVEVGGYTEDRPELSEGELWLRMVLTGSRVRLVREPLYHYVLSSAGMSSDRTVVPRHQANSLQMMVESDLLDPAQRVIAERELLRLRSVSAAASARQSLIERRPGGRRDAFRAAGGVGLRLRQRCSLMAMGLVPRLAPRIWSTPLERHIAASNAPMRTASSS